MTTYFENDDTFENASLMLEVCLEVFERGGHTTEAQQLKGLEATSYATAYASMLSLQNVKARDEDTAAAKKFTLDALRLIVQPSKLPLAG